MEYKTRERFTPIQININIHKQFKSYCDSRNLKIGKEVERLIREELKQSRLIKFLKGK